MDYYITLNHQKIPVTESVYKAWCHGARKERYFREGDILNGVFSYHALDTEELNGCDLFTYSNESSTESLAECHLLIAQLPSALETLSFDEKELILKLYVHEQTLRQIARETGVPLSTLQYRHKKTLNKLRYFFEHVFCPSDE